MRKSSIISNSTWSLKVLDSMHTVCFLFGFFVIHGKWTLHRIFVVLLNHPRWTSSLDFWFRQEDHASRYQGTSHLFNLSSELVYIIIKCSGTSFAHALHFRYSLFAQIKRRTFNLFATRQDTLSNIIENFYMFQRVLWLLLLQVRISGPR